MSIDSFDSLKKNKRGMVTKEQLEQQQKLQKERWLLNNRDALTVEQLIEQLQKMPPGIKVFSRYDHDEYGSWEQKVTGVKELTLKNGFQIIMLDADFDDDG